MEGPSVKEQAMPMTLSSASGKVTVPVMVSIGVSVLNTLIMAVVAQVALGLTAALIGAVTYWLVLRNLPGNPATARLAAIGIAIVHAFFAIVSIAAHNVLFFGLDAIAAGCLTYTYFQLRKA
jgi:hypothetical protein